MTNTNAVRTAVSPRMGVFVVRPVSTGFEATPLVPATGDNFGILAFYAPDMETIIRNIRSW